MARRAAHAATAVVAARARDRETMAVRQPKRAPTGAHRPALPMPPMPDAERPVRHGHLGRLRQRGVGRRADAGDAPADVTGEGADVVVAARRSARWLLVQAARTARPQAAPRHSTRRVVCSPPTPMPPKLQKVLAQAGVGSRRDLEQMIVDKRVTVNGEPAHTGQRISWGDRVAVDGKPVRVRIAPLPTRVIAYHKPAGEVVTPRRPAAAADRVPPPAAAAARQVAIGRATGHQHRRPVAVHHLGRTGQPVDAPALRRRARVRGARARHTRQRGPRAPARRRADRRPAGRLQEHRRRWRRRCRTTGTASSSPKGRNREVRKLFEAVGLTVSRLIRIRYGSVVLPRGLKRGVWVDLAEDDVRLLRRLTGLGVPARAAAATTSAGRRPRREGPRPQGDARPAPAGRRVRSRPRRERQPPLDRTARSAR